MDECVSRALQTIEAYERTKTSPILISPQRKARDVPPTPAEVRCRSPSPHAPPSRYNQSLRDSLKDPWSHIEHLHSILRSRDEEIAMLRGARQKHHQLVSPAKIVEYRIMNS